MRGDDPPRTRFPPLALRKPRHEAYLPAPLAGRVRVAEVDVEHLASRREQRRLAAAHQPALTVRAGDGVPVGDDVTGLEDVDAGGEEQGGDLPRLPVAEVALHLRQAEDIEAECVQHEGIV